MRVEISFHESPTRQVVENVLCCIYTVSVVAMHEVSGIVSVSPLVSIHRIREIPDT